MDGPSHRDARTLFVFSPFLFTFHRRSVSYGGHIIVDKPFIGERMGNAQRGERRAGTKREKTGGGKRDKRAQYDTQVRKVTYTCTYGLHFF